MKIEDHFTQSLELEVIPINQLYGHYLMASYLYYCLDQDTPWSDSQYDFVCKRLLAEWDSITHKLKGVCSRDLLEAGSGFTIKAHEYPRGLQHVATLWKEWGDTRGTK